MSPFHTLPQHPWETLDRLIGQTETLKASSSIARYGDNLAARAKRGINFLRIIAKDGGRGVKGF